MVAGILVVVMVVGTCEVIDNGLQRFDLEIGMGEFSFSLHHPGISKD